MAGDRAARRRLGGPLLFAAALLILAALASNLANLADPLPAVPRAPDPSPSAKGVLPPEILAVLVWAFAVAALALLLGMYLWVRKGLGRRTFPVWDLIGLVLAVTVLVLLLLAWPSLGPALQSVTAPDATNATATADGSTTASPLAVVRTIPVFLVVFTIAAFAFALATISRDILSRRTPPGSEEAAPAARADAARAVRRTIEDLEAGLDPRETILRCYAALCALLARRGLAGLDPLTPREVERRALSQFGLSEADVDAITSIFEEARYSEHPMGPDARDRALLAFSRVRTALEA